jgi:serine/threonine protein kinase
MSDQHSVSLQPGTVIGGKYEVVKCLGAGSMGMVYACRHKDLQGQLVAAKVLFDEVAQDSVAAARFKNEILASYGISHPNVVRAYEFIRDGGVTAYTMEFVGGGDLADRMSRTELVSIPECIRLLCQMTAGVQAIHDAGIVHRDLKPENILLTNEGMVKIADFGIARKTDGPKLTEHGGVVGTLEYVSPEYMLKSQVDWRSDIYAIGILAFELITGEAPFKGDSAYASISKRLQNDPEAPSVYRIEGSKDLDRIILKALKRDPEERYQSAAEMFYDLQKAAAGLGVLGEIGSGVLIPPESVFTGKRYVGPTLSKASDGQGRSAETQVLTTGGTVGYGGAGSKGYDFWDNPSPASAAEYNGAEDLRNADDHRARQPTDYLDPGTAFDYSRGQREKKTAGGVFKESSREESSSRIVSSGGFKASRSDGRGLKISSSNRMSSDLIERSHRRMKIVDLAIMVFAALSGIGAGYLFLRVFAPSFLDKLKLLGFGS